MADIADVAIVFVQKKRGELDEREREVLRIGSGTPTHILSYGTNSEADDALRSMVMDSPPGPYNKLEHLTEDHRKFEYIVNDLMSRFTGTLSIDITYASPYHAALATQFGLNRRVLVYYTRSGAEGYRKDLVNVHLKDYARLDDSSRRIVASIVENGYTNVSDIVTHTGFTDKKVYRLVQDMVKRGYLTADSAKKQKKLSLDDDQLMMYSITAELD